jgi:dTDP-4-amino-4,6-dideoxygalactose transaminase
MGVAQLEQIDDFINKKREIAHKYNELLSEIEGIKVNPDKEWAFNNYWLYSILIDEEKFGMDSKQLYKKLNDAGIMSRPFFKPIHNMPMYKDCDKSNTDNAAELWWQGINLPCSVSLEISKVEYISEKIKEIKGKQ